MSYRITVEEGPRTRVSQYTFEGKDKEFSNEPDPFLTAANKHGTLVPIVRDALRTLKHRASQLTFTKDTALCVGYAAGAPIVYTYSVAWKVLRLVTFGHFWDHKTEQLAGQFTYLGAAKQYVKDLAKVVGMIALAPIGMSALFFAAFYFAITKPSEIHKLNEILFDSAPVREFEIYKTGNETLIGEFDELSEELSDREESAVVFTDSDLNAFSDVEDSATEWNSADIEALYSDSEYALK